MVLFLVDFDQKRLHVDPKQMIEDEINWLQGFSPSSSAALQAADSALMEGHFRLIKTLLTCDGVQKNEAGEFRKVKIHYIFLISGKLILLFKCPGKLPENVII